MRLLYLYLNFVIQTQQKRPLKLFMEQHISFKKKLKFNIM